MQGRPEPIDATRSNREELAKAWLLRLVENSSLEDIGDLSLSWVASEAPPLITEILASLADPVRAARPEPAQRARFSRITSLRRGEAASELLPRDLAALQSLLIEVLGREAPDEPADRSAAAGRLAEVFGEIQGEVTRKLVEERSGGAAHDPVTGLPGPAQLHEWGRILVAEQDRYGHPFAAALVGVDGLDRVNDAYGRRSGERILAAVASVVGRRIRAVDQAFRTGDDELCVLAPHQEPHAMVAMAERLAALLASSQLPTGPRVAITVGIAGCPADGDSVERLLDAAEEASYAARAAGVHVATASPEAPSPLQDP